MESDNQHIKINYAYLNVYNDFLSPKKDFLQVHFMTRKTYSMPDKSNFF